MSRKPENGREHKQMGKEICTAIILAAGQGKRMNSNIQKQYLLLQGYPLLYYSVKAFEGSLVDRIILVTGPEELEYCKKEIVERYNFRKVHKIVAGGKERYHSVYEGLKAAEGTDFCFIHDGARPFVTQEIINRTLEGAKCCGACAAGMPVKDTIKIINENGFTESTPDRTGLWLVQTPQTFSYPLIMKAYQELIEHEAAGENIKVTDDAMVLETISGKQSRLVEGSYENIKITTPSDLQIAEALCKRDLKNV